MKSSAPSHLVQFCKLSIISLLRLAGRSQAADREFDLIWSADLPVLGSPQSLVVRDVAVSDNLVLFALGSGGLMILDLTDRSQPRWIGSLNTTEAANSLALRGNTVFLAGDGLLAVDITDPSHPRRLGTLLQGEPIHGVATAGDSVVAAAADGLIIIDWSDPSSPLVVARYRPGQSAAGSLHGTSQPSSSSRIWIWVSSSWT